MQEYLIETPSSYFPTVPELTSMEDESVEPSSGAPIIEPDSNTSAIPRSQPTTDHQLVRGSSQEK